MNIAIRFGSALVIVCLLFQPVAPTQAQEDSTPVMRANSRLVQLNVVVLDKQGKPVTGLSRDDFQILDNGHEQKIEHFTASSPSSAPAEKSPLVITNRPKGDAAPPGVTVILVDERILQDENLYTDVITDFESAKQPIKSARLAVLKFLSTLTPGERVALYAWRKEGVVVVHDFTDDSAAIVAAAKTLGTGLDAANLSSGGTVETAAAARDIHHWMAAPLRNYSHNGTDFSRVLSGNGFQAIEHQLRGIPGRKNLVWISSWLPWMTSGLNVDIMAGERDTILPNQWGPTRPVFISPEGHYDQLRGFARALAGSDISVYPMDPGGLLTADVSGSSASPTGEYSRSVSIPEVPSVGSDFSGPWAATDLLASETGGRAVYDSNALAQHLREIVEEGNDSYQLGYYPGDAAWDGKYHHIQVKLKREDLIALCRKGYYAKDESMPDPDHALRDAAKVPLDSSGIGVTLNVSSNPLESGAEDVVLKLDTHDIQFQQRDGRWQASIDVGFADLSKDGRILGGNEDHLDLALKPETYEEANAQGWFYPKKLFVDSGAERLRVIVRDRATGGEGSVSVPVQHE